jgi:hypothetical protein
MFDEGTLDKMRIIACTNENFDEDPEVPPYVVQVNPESYSLNTYIVYNDQQAPGDPATQLRYDRTTPQELSFQFLFDGTGVISQGGGLLKIANLFGGDKPKTVQEQLDSFRKVVGYKGKMHEPGYIKLVWGKALAFEQNTFKCRLTSMQLTYKLFKPDGTPLRATAQCTFRESISPKELQARKNNSSPDLTHVRTVKEGDTLPLMTYRIYGDDKYYLEVAKANGLQNFRKLTVGQTIIFPPIQK